MKLDDADSNCGIQIDGGNAHEAQMYQFHGAPLKTDTTTILEDVTIRHV